MTNHERDFVQAFFDIFTHPSVDYRKAYALMISFNPGDLSEKYQEWNSAVVAVLGYMVRNLDG